MAIDVRAPEQRFVTEAEGRTTYHSFSFGAHYDPHNVGFGAMAAHNDEWLPPGTGYADHPHRNTEIVTLVLTGALQHRDSFGNNHLVGPGQVQRLSAGHGVVHSEVSASPEQTRLLQAWIRPDEPDTEPSYVLADGPVGPGLRCLASGDDEMAAVRLGTRGAVLYLATLEPGQRLVLPESPRLHVFVTGGGLMLGERLLLDGAAGRLVDEGGRVVEATEQPTGLLVWALT